VENWVAFVPVLQGWVNEWTELLSKLSGDLAIALAMLPIALAIVSRRWVFVGGSAILALTALCLFISPSNAVAILETGFYVGSLGMAVAAILVRRKAKNTEVELATLRAQITDLLASEQRRLLRDIRSSSKDRLTNVSKPVSDK
jgi:hypothetical protein